MAGMLKKLSLDADRSAGVAEVVAMVKEGGIAALKARPPVLGFSSDAATAQRLCLCPCMGHEACLCSLLFHFAPLLPKQLVQVPQGAVHSQQRA